MSRQFFQRAVAAIREGRPADFSKTIANKPTEVVFAGIQNENLALVVRGLVADWSGKIHIERFESTAPRYPRLGYFIGLNGHIRSYLRTHPNWIRDDYRELARRLVQLEIEAHPDIAGPPTSELQIEKDGEVHWLDKGACDSARSIGTTGEIMGN